MSHISFSKSNTKHVIGGLLREHPVSVTFKMEFSKITTMSECMFHTFLFVLCQWGNHCIRSAAFSYTQHVVEIHSESVGCSFIKWWIATISWDCLGYWLPKCTSFRQLSDVPQRAVICVLTDDRLSCWDGFTLAVKGIGSITLLSEDDHWSQYHLFTQE